MQRILYILCLFCLTISCQKEDYLFSSSKPGKNEKAVFTFTPSFQDISGPETKVMAARPNVQEIYFAVFDNETKKLVEYVPAILNTSAILDSVKYSYNVELTVSDKARIVHILGNGPSSVPYGSETEVMGSLTTRFNENTWTGDDAYWQKMVFEDGICGMPDANTALTDTSYNTKFEKYRGIINKLSEARLVRNFVKISVVENAENFTMSRFWVTNIPDVGAIAPYNRNTKNFQVDYNTYNSIFEVRGTGQGQANYQGYTPATADIIKIGGKTTAQLEAIQVDETKGFTTFVYEREVPESNPMYVIIGGYFGDGNTTEETFYKVDIRDDEGNYFPILRNFDYRINVQGVSQKGASTVEGALNGVPSGEISTNLDMQGITNISNGVSQMFVSETERVLVGTSSGTDDIILRYKYIPDLTVDLDNDGHADVCNTVSSEDSDHSDMQPYVSITTSSGSSGNVFSNWDIATNDETIDDYRVITLYPIAASSAVKTETITITGHVYNDQKRIWEKLSRTIHYQLREKLNMTLELTPGKIANQIGQPLKLTIKLPAGLPSTIFSLPLTIESQGLYITPDGNSLPVSTGTSSIEGSESKSAFMFTKAISWDDYNFAPTYIDSLDAYKEFICYFKTNTSALSNDNIYVSNEYFNQTHIGYSIFTPSTFSGLSITPASLKIGDTASFSFKLDGNIPSDGKVQIGMNGFEPDSTETRLTYAGASSDGLWELYDFSISSVGPHTVSVVPYKSSTCSLAVLGDEYTTASTSTNVQKGDIEVFADVSGTVSGCDDLIATTAPKAGSFIKGQSSKLTVYLSVDNAVSPKLGTMTLSKVSGKTYVHNGETLYAYQTTTSYSANTASVIDLSVTVNSKIVGSISFPVYTITVNTGQEISDKTDLTNGYVIWKNRDYSGNQYLDCTNNSLSLKSINNLSLYSLFTVSSITNSSYHYIRSYMNSSYYLRLGSGSAKLSTTSTQIEIAQQTSSSDTKAYRLKLSGNNNYYLYISSGNLTAGNRTSNSYWYAYHPVFKAPTGWSE